MHIGLLLLLAPTYIRSKSCDNGFFSNEDQHACFEDDCCSCECKITNKSFFSIRPVFEAASPPKIAIVRKEMQKLQYHNGSLFQAVPFGGKTMKPERLAWYFGPSCKRVLLVTEQSTPDTDILSGQLNIVTQNGDFESRFVLSPVQTFAGVGFNYRTHFGFKDQNKGFFIDLTLPVYYVRNLMNLEEQIINNGGGPLTPDNVDSVKEAFQQPSWCFGKIDDYCDTTEVGASELDVQVGYGWGREQAHMHSYIGVIVPTGNKVKSHKVFEPIIGWNHNAAFHFGSTLGMRLWYDESKDHAIWYEFAIDSRYFFENTQHRSFDLKNKPWSRYMMVYSNKAQAAQADEACINGDVTLGQMIGTPGINLFTQAVKVSPRFQRTYNTAFAFDLTNLTLEAGYNFFTRDEECVKLDCAWDRVAGIVYERNADGQFVPIDGPALKSLLGCGQTDSVQMIGNDFGNANVEDFAHYDLNIITERDLDLSSAEAPALLSQRLYVAVGYSIESCRIRTLLGIGGEYEFCGDNTGIDRWGTWAKIAFIF